MLSRAGAPFVRWRADGGQNRAPPPWFDTASKVAHPTGVVTLARRLSGMALVLALIHGNIAAACAGWAPTAEARMVCCADPNCPMHKGSALKSHGKHPGSQERADSCCASSERETSGPTGAQVAAPVPALHLATSILLPTDPPALVLRSGQRSRSPVLSPQTPKHVLLSVFLV